MNAGPKETSDQITIKQGLFEAYEKGHAQATSFYMEMFRQAAMEDAAMMVHASGLVRQKIMLKKQFSEPAGDL